MHIYDSILIQCVGWLWVLERTTQNGVLHTNIECISYRALKQHDIILITIVIIICIMCFICDFYDIYGSPYQIFHWARISSNWIRIPIDVLMPQRLTLRVICRALDWLVKIVILFLCFERFSNNSKKSIVCKINGRTLFESFSLHIERAPAKKSKKLSCSFYLAALDCE